MQLTLEIIGLNLEKLLQKLAEEGIVVRHAQRMDTRIFRMEIDAAHRETLDRLCERYGWEVREVRASFGVRSLRFLRRRAALIPGLAIGILLVWLSGEMLWRIQIDHAGENIAEIRNFLREEGVVPGTFKRVHSLSELRAEMSLALPGLAFVGLRWSGSTLIVDCQPAQEGEIALDAGESLDLVAAQDGIITKMAVYSGTPVVEIGQAVHAGQVLVRGEERSEAGTMRIVQAQGVIEARVWARGDARTSTYTQRTVETGRYSTRVTLRSPWSARIVREAQPFEQQDVSVRIEPVVGLYLPVWREIETFAEIEIVREPKNAGDAASSAQAAAEKMAKLKCPLDAKILDKWVDYSMIDDEFVCATVVLEYEQNIATRAEGALQSEE